MANRVMVPAVSDMTTVNFKKHINLRHGGDYHAPFADRENADGVIKPAKAYHDRLHAADPDRYDHDHKLEES